MKKLFALILVLAMTLSLAACGGKEEPAPEKEETKTETEAEAETGKTETEEPKLRMAMITDAGGLGDGGFNDMAWAGMERARDELGYEIGLIESTEASQYAASIAAAADQGYNVVLCVGFLLVDALAEVAPQYPDTKFIIIDGAVEGDNVFSYTYSMEQSGFLAGALAAYVLDDCDTFGSVGGMEIPDVIAWATGYKAGVLTVNPDANVLLTYVGSFADPGIAKELALAQFAQGAEVVMEISSGGAIGVIEGAASAGKQFIATDKSKDSFAPGSEFTAALAGRDSAVYEAAKKIKEGTAVAGISKLTMKDGVFGLPDNTEERYGADAAAFIEKLQTMIANDEIKVPRTYEDMEAFTLPVLD